MQRVESILREFRGDEIGATGRLVPLFFREKGKDGLTFGERWEKENFNGLKNDERVTFKRKMETTAVLIEVQTVVDENSLICANLLGDPGKRITIYDRSFAARACRFQRFFSLSYPTLEYWKLTGGAVEVNDFGTIGAREGFEMVVSHLGGELNKDWLTDNFVKVSEALLAAGRERHRLKLANTDFNLIRVDYELGEFEDQFAQRLFKAGCIEDDVNAEASDAGYDSVFIWPDKESKDVQITSMGGTPYLGSVMLKPGGVRLEASRRELMEALRKRFEKVAGKKVRFVRELVEDIAAQKSLEIEEGDHSLVPPALLENVGGMQIASSLVDLPDSDSGNFQSLNDYLETYYRKILEEPVPQLDGLTPIEAAQDFVARPKLVEWAKGLVRTADYQSLTTGEEVDVNWMLKELNLGEIDFPPPPKRLPIESPHNDESLGGLEDGEWEDLENTLNYWEDVVMNRINEYNTAALALEEMEASGFTLVDDLFELTGGLIDENTYNTFIPMLIMVWAAIVPKGMKVSIAKEDCDQAIGDAMDDIQDISSHSEGSVASELSELCVEPELFALLSMRFEETVKSLPRKERPKEEKMGGVMIALIAAINVTVDAVNRKSPPF